MANRFVARLGIPLAGSLAYSVGDMSFSFRPKNAADLARRVGDEGLTSLVADSIQLEVAVATGEVLYVWGYLPRRSWRQASLQFPGATYGVVRVELEDPPLEEAVSVSIARTEWAAYFDESSGYVRLIRADPGRVEILYQVAEGVFLGLSGDLLNSIWLKPQMVA
jgi:hypothetical protein